MILVMSLNVLCYLILALVRLTLTRRSEVRPDHAGICETIDSNEAIMKLDLVVVCGMRVGSS